MNKSFLFLIFRSTQQHTLDTPPNTLSAITISRPNSQCIELTSLSDLDRRPDGAEQTDAGEPSEFYGSRHSNPMDRERQRTSGCSTDCTNATTFGKEKVVQKPPDVPTNDGESKKRISGTSSAGLSRTSRSSVSGSSLTAAADVRTSLKAYHIVCVCLSVHFGKLLQATLYFSVLCTVPHEEAFTYVPECPASQSLFEITKLIQFEITIVPL